MGVSGPTRRAWLGVAALAVVGGVTQGCIEHLPSEECGSLRPTVQLLTWHGDPWSRTDRVARPIREGGVLRVAVGPSGGWWIPFGLAVAAVQPRPADGRIDDPWYDVEATVTDDDGKVIGGWYGPIAAARVGDARLWLDVSDYSAVREVAVHAVVGGACDRSAEARVGHLRLERCFSAEECP